MPVGQAGVLVFASGSTHQEPSQGTQQTRRSETDARDAALAGHEAELRQLIQTKMQGLFHKILAEVKEELRSGALAGKYMHERNLRSAFLRVAL